MLELTLLTGTKLPPTCSVWYCGEFTIRRPFRRTRVFPVPRLRRLKAPTSPPAEFTPPLMFAASLTKLFPFSGMRSRSWSPESIPKISIVSLPTMEMGNASEMTAPRICEPVTTTSSSASSAGTGCWAKSGKLAPMLSATTKSIAVLFLDCIYLSISY